MPLTETGLLTLFQSFFALVTTIFGGFITYKIAMIQKQGDNIHTLVNSQYGSALKISAVALRRVADTSKSVADIAAAVEAERLLTEHVNKQAIVDSNR
jgi:hypothetical protein